MGAPTVERDLRGVVVGEVVVGDLRVQPLAEVSAVFERDRFGVVFQMAGDEDLSAAFGCQNTDAGAVGERDDVEVLQASTSSTAISVWRECGTRKRSSKPRTSGYFGCCSEWR